MQVVSRVEVKKEREVRQDLLEYAVPLRSCSFYPPDCGEMISRNHHRSLRLFQPRPSLRNIRTGLFP